MLNKAQRFSENSLYFICRLERVCREEERKINYYFMNKVLHVLCFEGCRVKEKDMIL